MEQLRATFKATCVPQWRSRWYPAALKLVIQNNLHKFGATCWPIGQVRCSKDGLLVATFGRDWTDF
jgi:hypothetical protein